MTEGSARRPGRPRSEASRAAILSSAFDELHERGYAEFAIESVARRAGVGKATVYRWWADRAALAVESFFEHTRDELAFPETGSARADFEAQIVKLGALLRTRAGSVLVSMMLGARHDEVLRGALVERWVEPRRRWGLRRLERAMAEGECARSLDAPAALEVLYGPLYARLFVGLGPAPEAVIRGYLAIVLPAVFHRTRA